VSTLITALVIGQVNRCRTGSALIDTFGIFPIRLRFYYTAVKKLTGKLLADPAEIRLITERDRHDT